MEFNPATPQYSNQELRNLAFELTDLYQKGIVQASFYDYSIKTLISLFIAQRIEKIALEQSILWEKKMSKVVSYSKIYNHS
ncbi:MAG: hypothetical protein HQ591_08845 [candidate division Zixibacteria bacterium]|nr:hypothetical protein [Candidatus Tariuqbacter arcticus]